MILSTYAWKALCAIGLAALAEAYSTHQISVTMVVDGAFELTINGECIKGPIPAPSLPSGQNVQTYTRVVQDDGPWVIAIQATDTGNLAGLFASVLVDGVPYSTTASLNNRFRMTSIPPTDYWKTDPRYDDRSWYTQTYDSCSPYNSVWGAMLPTLDNITDCQTARSMWYPDCRNAGTPAAPVTVYFRLVFGPPSTPIVFIPNPVPSHTLAITMAVDDYYNLNLDGQTASLPVSAISFQNVTTYTKTVLGDGPWMVSVHGHDGGAIAGFFAVVTLDGVPYSTTATSTNKFRMTPNTPNVGWDTSLTYDDSAWYTQTTDTCHDYASLWAGLLPTLDAKTRPQVARAMWYPDCYSVGANPVFKSMYFRLRVGGPKPPPIAVVPQPIPTHVLAITMAVDSNYEIIIDGFNSVQPLNPTSNQNVTTYTKTVSGDGPWVIAISGHDSGNLAGLFAYVTLDGIPYSTTATSNNKFRMTPNYPGNGWASNPNFNDATWFTQTTDTCTNYDDAWKTLIPLIDSKSAGQKPRAMWYPDCHSTGTPSSSATVFFRLVVTSSQGAPVAFVPNPVPSHVLAITMAVDDYYDLSLDGQTVSMPVSVTSFQNVATYTKTVYGDGPWMVSVHGHDGGTIAGFFAAVTLDGVPYSTTATSTNKFRMTPNTPGAGWGTSLTYDDSAWYTQTTDTCHDYASLWAGLLPTLDAKTSPQVARAMWYPDCYNVGANPVFKDMYFRLRVNSPKSPPVVFVPNPVPSHTLAITMAVDDYYVLNLDGQIVSTPVSVTSFQDVATYTKTVYGDGPWMVSVHGHDGGAIAGFFAVVTLDGVPYSTTATSTNKFRMTPNTPGAGWGTSLTYDDSAWYTQTTDTCHDYASLWAGLLPTLDAKTSPQVARAMWYPDCYNVGANPVFKDMYFRLRVNSPKSPPVVFVPNPVPSHTLAITMAVDDYYVLNLDGQIVSTPVSVTSFQDVATYTKTVYGDGPWMVSVHGHDGGAIAGFFAVVTLDGVPYSTTATSTNKFRMTPNTPGAGWGTSLTYDDSAWYTQTTDTCHDYASLWAGLLPTLDAKTSPQVARAMWYPDCYNVGANPVFKDMYFRLRVNSPKSPPVVFVPNPVKSHVLAITMAVDDYYELNLDGQTVSMPVSVTSFQNVATYTKTVYGDGPWMVSVHGHDGGAIAGFFAVVTLDGVPYSTTATATNKFRMTPNTPNVGWDTSLTYDDSAWFTQTTDTCHDYASLWAGLLPTLDAKTSPQVARAMWYPDCYNVGANPVFKDMYFRLRVNSPKSPPVVFVPNPIKSHTLAITMAVDDYYVLNLDGQIVSTPVSVTSFQDVATYTKTVYGDGPWMVSVHGHDGGAIAGFFAVVTLDGVPYSTTATSTNKFRMTPNTPSSGWDTSLTYDDSAWFTQTTDTCHDYASLWSTLLPTLDAKTSPQVARAMWYPDCYNVGATPVFKSMYFRLRVNSPKSPPVVFVPNPVKSHVLAITIDVDDNYDLNLDGQIVSTPVSVTSWQNVVTYTKTVYGDGPWLVSVHGHDIGTIAGLFAVVTLDGVPYSTTATSTNKFRMTPNTPGAGWDTSLTYDDSAWYTQTTETCHDYLPLWSDLLKIIDAKTSPQVARAMWYPNCRGTGTISAPKSMYFRLRVGAPSAPPLAFVPNPVPSHVIGITMAVDDNYTVIINGVAYTIPFSLTSYEIVTTYTKTVYGDGPWLITVQGQDIGNVAGLFAVVTIDGVPYSTTATPTNKFRMTPNAPAAGWNTDVYFNDAAWYTQTTDTCTDYNNQWPNLLPNLYAKTSPQVARAMWYHNCKNTGTMSAPKSMYFRLVVVGPRSVYTPPPLHPVGVHTLAITMALDDHYRLNLDGAVYTVPYSPTSWQNVQTYTKIAFGDGPWLITVQGQDIGNVAGLFAVVTLDGVPYSTTATPTNKFRMTPNIPAPGWNTNIYFNDASWYTQTADTCTSYNDQWTALLPNLDARTRPQVARSMWYPNCKNTGTLSAPKNMYFRLRVVNPKPLPLPPSQSKPVSGKPDSIASPPAYNQPSSASSSTPRSQYSVPVPANAEYVSSPPNTYRVKRSNRAGQHCAFDNVELL
ncbi:hypothetical protein BASA61_001073 [Batrachochytrium salamandrivorans]|nr:hypothetical protein BASA61_001073 [Batrachochytrium salamandrivorans]